MAQDFALRYPLVDGQGNFGNIDGDNAAARGYTEARMSKAAELLLADIDKDTVDFRVTYDDEGEEPIVCPQLFLIYWLMDRRHCSWNGNFNSSSQY